MSNILLIEDNEAIIMGLEYLFTNNGSNQVTYYLNYL